MFLVSKKWSWVPLSLDFSTNLGNNHGAWVNFAVSLYFTQEEKLDGGWTAALSPTGQ